MLTGHSLANECGTLLAVDTNFCEILARDKHEVVGLTYEAFTHPDDLARNIAMVASLRKTDGLLTIRKRYIRPDNTNVWATVLMSRLQEKDGNIVGTIQLAEKEHSCGEPQALRHSALTEVARVESRRIQLGEELFSDFPWLILLQVYLAEAEGRPTASSSLAKVIDLRVEATARWLCVLEARSLVERSTSENNLVQLTGCGYVQVEALLSASSSS